MNLKIDLKLAILVLTIKAETRIQLQTVNLICMVVYQVKPTNKTTLIRNNILSVILIFLDIHITRGEGGLVIRNELNHLGWLDITASCSREGSCMEMG